MKGFIWGLLMVLPTSLALGHDFTVEVQPQGGMSGGGGGLVRDANNPWFIQNSKEATYCIDIDANHFKPSLEVTSGLIQKAFAYWQEEFKDTFSPVKGTEIEPIRIATQTFTEVACEDNPDIVFQMGHLTSEQAARFDNPTLYAGSVMRESYDSKQLRGKGVVYIAADSGPLRFNGTAVADFWCLGKGGLLYRTLVHELGHVFGLGHMGGSTEVMSSRYLEEVFNEAELYAEGLNLGSFFKFRGRKSGSKTTSLSMQDSLHEKTLAFFGLSPDFRGLEFAVSEKNGFLDVSGFKKSAQEQTTKVGEIVILPQDSPLAYQWFHAITVYLPSEQKVYPKDRLGDQKSLFGPRIEIAIRRGIYRTLDGATTQEVILHLEPRGPSHLIGGVIDGKYYADVVMGFSE